MSGRLKQGFDFLVERGLNLAAVFDCAGLPEDVVGVMVAAGVPLADYKRLLLLGHGGRQFWRALNVFGWQTADPVDYFSIHLSQTFLRDYLGNPPHLRLYPLTDYVVPLQRLGELAGWCRPSPLGLGDQRPTYGLWFAYRAAFLVDADLPPTICAPPASPCDTCAGKPCVADCPPGAVRLAGFDVFRCSSFRLETHSPCHDRCLARLACPVAPEHRYTLEQVQYHYGRSLQTIREYFGEE